LEIINPVGQGRARENIVEGSDGSPQLLDIEKGFGLSRAEQVIALLEGEGAVIYQGLYESEIQENNKAMEQGLTLDILGGQSQSQRGLKHKLLLAQGSRAGG
jgi:hypothetical protein